MEGYDEITDVETVQGRIGNQQHCKWSWHAMAVVPDGLVAWSIRS